MEIQDHSHQLSCSVQEIAGAGRYVRSFIIDLPGFILWIKKENPIKHWLNRSPGSAWFFLPSCITALPLWIRLFETYWSAHCRIVYDIWSGLFFHIIPAADAKTEKDSRHRKKRSRAFVPACTDQPAFPVQ